MSDRGPHFTTYTGIRFYLLDPRIEDIDIVDIAHAEAAICRFGGHTARHYSVAQHSVLVSHVVPARDALAGLLHDAPEAYLGDVIGPLKGLLALLYGPLEERLQRLILWKFGVDSTLPESVHLADRILLATEQRDVRGRPHHDPKLPAPLVERIDPWPAARAEEEFLVRFANLIHRKQAAEAPTSPELPDDGEEETVYDAKRNA